MGESTIPPCFTDFRSPYQPPQLNISTQRFFGVSYCEDFYLFGTHLNNFFREKWHCLKKGCGKCTAVCFMTSLFLGFLSLVLHLSGVRIKLYRQHLSTQHIMTKGKTRFFSFTANTHIGGQVYDHLGETPRAV